MGTANGDGGKDAVAYRHYFVAGYRLSAYFRDLTGPVSPSFEKTSTFVHGDGRVVGFKTFQQNGTLANLLTIASARLVDASDRDPVTTQAAFSTAMGSPLVISKPSTTPLILMSSSLVWQLDMQANCDPGYQCPAIPSGGSTNWGLVSPEGYVSNNGNTRVCVNGELCPLGSSVAQPCNFPGFYCTGGRKLPCKWTFLVFEALCSLLS